MTAKKTVKATPQLEAPVRPSLISRLAPYRKAVVAFLAGTLGWVGTCYVPDGHVSRPEWYALAVIAAGVLGVQQVPNRETSE